MHHVWPNQLTSIFGDDEAIPNDLLYLLIIYNIFLGSLSIMANPMANVPGGILWHLQMRLLPMIQHLLYLH